MALWKQEMLLTPVVHVERFQVCLCLGPVRVERKVTVASKHINIASHLGLKLKTIELICMSGS